MNDERFLEVFESGRLPNSEFKHRDHLRMAWLYLLRDGWECGTANIRTHLKHFAAYHGHADKYHETITMFWAHIIQYAITQSPHLTEFDAFIDEYAHLLDKTLMSQHYSAGVLKSDDARATWIEPDFLPLPDFA